MAIYMYGGVTYDSNTGTFYDAASGTTSDATEYDQFNIVNGAWGDPVSPDAAQIVDAAGQSNWSMVNDLLAQIPAAITGLTAFQLAQVNIERARRGQAPLNAAAYQPQVGVNLAPQTMQTVMMIALGLGALFLFARR